MPSAAHGPRLSVAFDSEATDQELLHQVLHFYAHALATDEDARAYLSRRTLDLPELVAHFRLGVANRALGVELPHNRLAAGKRIRARLERLGVLRKSGHEHFRGSVVVPIYDATGTQVVDVYARKIGRGLRRGTPLHLFLGETPAAPLFNLPALASARQIVFTPGVIDALTFWRHGFHDVVSLFGADTFTDDHVALLKAHAVERVFIAFRRDADGDRAARNAAALLSARGVEVFGVVFPRGMDANDFVVAVDDPRQKLQTALRNATWLGAGEPSSLPWVTFGENVDNVEPEVIQPASTTIRGLLTVGADEQSTALAHFRPPVQEPPPRNGEPGAQPNPVVDAHDDEVTLKLGNNVWRVRGLSQNTSVNSLKVNLLVTNDSGFHVDVVQLYIARSRNAFVREAAAELGVPTSALKRDLGKVLMTVEAAQEKRIADAMAPESKVPAMTDEEREAALALLRDPRLLDRVVEDLDTCGVVGEETNKKVGYAATTSRKQAKPIGTIIQSLSAAGKTALASGLLGFVPPEDRVSFSAMTGQSLYYMAADALKHKVLSIAEEEGAKRASYALKLLQSEGQLTIASTTKDTAGRMATEEYVVEGPTQLMLTTTSIDVDEELLNRCVVLTVDEGREQTRAIQDRQRQARTLDGILSRRERERLVQLHQNAQRLIEPLTVVNPFACALTFVDFTTRTRRDHVKYLTLIESIALIHQHQRAVKTIEHGGETVRYIEVEPRDIAIANTLADEVLGRSLDELKPQTRSLLTLLDQLVGERCHQDKLERRDFRFTRKWLRQNTHWSDTQLRVHLDRLVRMEYVLVHRGGRGQCFVYELLFDGRGLDGTPRLNGLIDPTTLG